MKNMRYWLDSIANASPTPEPEHVIPIHGDCGGPLVEVVARYEDGSYLRISPERKPVAYCPFCGHGAAYHCTRCDETWYGGDQWPGPVQRSTKGDVPGIPLRLAYELARIAGAIEARDALVDNHPSAPVQWSDSADVQEAAHWLRVLAKRAAPTPTEEREEVERGE